MRHGVSPFLSTVDAKKLLAHIRDCTTAEIRDSDDGVQYLKGLTTKEVHALFTNFPQISWSTHVARFNPFERLIREIELIQPSIDMFCSMKTCLQAISLLDPEGDHCPPGLFENALNALGVDYSAPFSYDKTLKMLNQPTTGLESTATQLKRISCLRPYENDYIDDELMPSTEPKVPLALSSQQGLQNILPERSQQSQEASNPSRDFFLKRARSDNGLHRTLISNKGPFLTKLICEKLLTGSYAYSTTGELAKFAKFHRDFSEKEDAQGDMGTRKEICYGVSKEMVARPKFQPFYARNNHKKRKPKSRIIENYGFF